MVPERTSSTREGRWPRERWTRLTISRTRAWYSPSPADSLRTSATTCSRWVPVRSLSRPTAAE